MTAVALEEEMINFDEILDAIVVEEEKNINIFDMFVFHQLQAE